MGLIGPYIRRRIDGGPDSHKCRENFDVKKEAGPGHVWTCPAVDILKATQ